MNKPRLIIMVGISASGKSTIAKQLAEKENAIIISSDVIRAELCNGNVSDQSKNEEVFKLYHKRIRENLLAGNNVICDATNIILKSRRAIFNAINGIDCEKIGYIVAKKIEDCIKDNHNHDRVAVPDYVIEKQIRKFQVPFKEEGFDDIIIDCLDIEYNSTWDFTMYLDMLDFDQKSHYHSQTLDNHCIFVNRMFKKYNYPKYYDIATLLHDYAKIHTQTFDDNGEAHYFGHENYSAYSLLTNYYNFRNDEYSNDEILNIVFLVNYHMLPMNWNTDKSKEKWRKIFGNYRYQLLLDFYECDKMRPE